MALLRTTRPLKPLPILTVSGRNDFICRVAHEDTTVLWTKSSPRFTLGRMDPLAAADALRTIAGGLRLAASGVTELAKAVEDDPAAPLPTPEPVPVPPTPEPTPPAPTGGFFVDPGSTAAVAAARAKAEGRADDAAALGRLAAVPQAVWFNGGDVVPFSQVAGAAKLAGSELVAVLYNVPGRDEGNHSSGGAASVNAYKLAVDAFAAALTGVRATIVIEPDAVILPDYLDAIRIECLNYAMAKLSTLPFARCYIDAGHSNWRSFDDMAARLKQLTLPATMGLALNVSNTQPTANIAKFAVDLGDRLGGRNFIIDTSRNGAGRTDIDWCNGHGALLGRTMSHDTGIARCDLVGWIKRPGESDGACNGGPGAGQWFEAYALDIVRRSIAAGKF